MKVVTGEPTDAEIGELWRRKQAEEMIRQFREWSESLPVEQRPDETMENLIKFAEDGFLKLDPAGKIAPR
jgi:hypothetical protein